MGENAGFRDYVCQYTEAIKLFLAINVMLLVVSVGNALWVPLAPASRTITVINVVLLLGSAAVALVVYHVCRRRSIEAND